MNKVVVLGSMKRISTILFLVFVSSNLLAQISFKENMGDFMELSYEVEYETHALSDSVDSQFIVVTITQPQIVDSIVYIPDARLFIDQYYCNLSTFYVQQEACRLYPIHFEYGAHENAVDSLVMKTMKGYYLIDDFKKDGIELVLQIQSGYMLQSQMNSSEHRVQLQFIRNENKRTKGPLANVKWYKNWRKTNPAGYNPRSYQSAYSNCK